MTTKRLDERTGRSHSQVNVRLAPAARGGWDVITTLGERILATQHCDDWHRAERAFWRSSVDARLRRGEAA